MFVTYWIKILIAIGTVAMVVIMIVTMIDMVRTDTTRVIFLDVGQGDAILITHGARQILIDGGVNDKALLEQLAKYMPFWDHTLDVVIATHPDADHIGAQIGLFHTYYVPVIIHTNVAHTSSAAMAWIQSAQQSGAKILIADATLQLRLQKDDEDSGILRILYPRTQQEAQNTPDTNSASIVVHMEVAGTSFLFTGDLPSSYEQFVMNSPVDVLKVGHHGSRFSTADFFLEAITPQQAVISVGRNNSYGHPTQEVLDRLRAHNVEVLRTDTQGTIVYDCKVSAQKCNVYTER